MTYEEESSLRSFLQEEDSYCNLLEDREYNLSGNTNQDFLLDCYSVKDAVICSSIHLIDFLERISKLYSVLHVQVAMQTGEELIFYNFENLQENSFNLTESTREMTQFRVLIFRLELMNALEFSSQQYNLDFNNNIFWVFVAVVFFGILNLGFILLLLGTPVNFR